MHLKKNWFILLLITLFYTPTINAQSIHVDGVFPTIDHSGTISNKFNYSLFRNNNWFNKYYLQLTWISHLYFQKK